MKTARGILVNFTYIKLENLLITKIGNIMCCFLFRGSYANEEPESQLQISTELGPMIGSYMTSDSGRTISAFRAIPYAKPPVGKLRFKVQRLKIQIHFFLSF